jgi:hypothetical protein
LGIEIAIDTGKHPIVGHIIGWPEPPGALGNWSYIQCPDSSGGSAPTRCKTGSASLHLDLEKSPCLTVEILQDQLRRNGWSFSGEIHSTMVDVFLPGQLVLEDLPYFEGVGELKGTGSLIFEFSRPGKNCATTLIASQFG